MQEERAPGLIETVKERLFNPYGPIVVHWLIFIKVILFACGFVWQTQTFRGTEPVLQWYGAFSEFTCYQQGAWWQLITYQFLHANLGHIVFNMFALWFFGPTVERRFGHWRFLFYYLYCGVAAAVFAAILGSMGFFDRLWQFIPMVGASGSIYGVMAACAVLFPHGRVQLLFPPINLSVRQFALVVLAIACAVILFQWDIAGGEAGHLGGMIAGFALTLLILFREKLEAMLHRTSAPGRRSPRPASAQVTNEEIDAIMEKIARSGLASLTDEERETLQKAAKR